MQNVRENWTETIRAALKTLHPDWPETEVIQETPPSSDLGDLAFPMHPYARIFRKSPQAIAGDVARHLEEAGHKLPGSAAAQGSYVNVSFDRRAFASDLLNDVEQFESQFGRTDHLLGQKVMCEFSCPNTNKPLHIGHLRNDCLGQSVSRILQACGAEVLKVNLINNRGIHICKSMLAYQNFGKGRTPESENKKPDHFVGDYYVRYNVWAAEDSSAENSAREMLLAWEQGDPEIRELWQKMNGWTIDGINATYRRTAITFDRIYYESDTYLLGKEIVAKGLEEKVFYRKDDGSVWIDLSGEGLDHKALLRGDGTSIYITQDFGTAVKRHEEWPFDRLIYIVASEQKYHFRVLFIILSKLDYSWADGLHHLAYGMVNLPDGRIKSREGNAPDADDLLDALAALAAQEIRAKGRQDAVGDVEATADKIAMGALNYYLLKVTALKDISFNPQESISFTGNTGPYLQYTGARICSVLRKHAQKMQSGDAGKFNADLLTVSEEWELIKLISIYSERLRQAADGCDPSIMANYLYDLARYFNRYYHDNPILHNENLDLVATRVRLLAAVKQTLVNGLRLIAIPFLESM